MITNLHTCRVLVSVALLSTLLTGCDGTGDTLVTSGRVTDTVVDVSVPPLSLPRSSVSTVAAVTGIGRATRVEHIVVAIGDHVDAGQTVALLDDGHLRADAAAARAAYRVALTRVDSIGARIDAVDDARATLADNRTEVEQTISELANTRRDLIDRMRDARTRQDDLKALRDRLSALPPDAPRPPGTPSQKEIDTALARLDSAVRQMVSGIARVDRGLARAREGLARLGEAQATVHEARDVLHGLRRSAQAATGVSRVGVELAQALIDRSVLRAPVSGTVTAVAADGEALATGAPLVTIRPSGPSAVTVWLSPEQRHRIGMGDAATVRLDSTPGMAYAARVTAIGTRAVYPPSWFATADTHMTRAFPVTLTCTGSNVRLPAGTPADVDITP